jgi:8-oxo-dGTP pyrophosphatase MutT (NUDIX family)
LIVIVLEVRFQRDGWSLWSCLAMIAIVLALLRYMEQRFKSTQQAYWLVLSLEASKAAPIPAASSQSAAVGEAALTHAGGVVFRRRKSITQFLMVQAKKDPNDWVLPKGHIEPGEEPRCCAIREVKEETGVWAGIVKELKPVEYEFEGKPVRVLFYLMEAIDHGNVQDPLREHEWLPLEDALHRTRYPSTAELLAVAGKELGLS